ncbi:MAG: lanthionine synthetase C family protein [Chitinophagaceae bacterium]
MNKTPTHTAGNSKRIYTVLQAISNALPGCIKKDEDVGLLSGHCGTALFYAYYYKLTGRKKYLLELNRIIVNTVETLGEQPLGGSHCSGFAGVAWCIQHLADNGFIEQEGVEDIFSELDPHMMKFMQTELANGRYDFLHEGLGLVLYFLNKLPDESVRHNLEEAVALIGEHAVSGECGIRWKDNFTQKGRLGNQCAAFNLGLAHGVPSIISVLCLLYEKNISVSKTLLLIEGAVKWLLSTRNSKREGSLSLYPSIVSADNQAIGEVHSRLGWCYGDLGIAVTLWNVGKRLKNEQYKQEALNIYDYTMVSRDKVNGIIGDACLCHGTMGVSHIFHRAYLETGDPAYSASAERWLHETLEMATWQDGPAGFKNEVRDGYQDSYNLLEGISGIGLALIAALDKGKDPGWDRCLLLS